MTAREDHEDFREIARALSAMGLIGEGEQFAIARLSGGVSCDVWRVEVKRRPPVVVKRALARLKVEAEWRAPPERAATEVAWIRLVAGIEPHWVPTILGEDRARHLFAMAFLPPETNPVWKSEVAAAFDHGAQFHALRLEPYLLFTAERHPHLAAAMRDEVARIAASRIALMQGDISPKNILCGPQGPVFLDAETACYGDPAFDLAFCLNHFLLKAVWHPEWTGLYAASFAALKDAYLAGATWEKAHEIDRRIARLLPMLFLARVDGKSPVEYLTDASDKSFVRAAAMQMIVEPPGNLDVLAHAFFPLAAERAG